MASILTSEARQIARQFNMRARQIFWPGIVPENSPLWRLDDDSRIDWILDYQQQRQMLADGCFGPSCLITMMAESIGGVGGFIIDGKEVQVENTRVARMFVPTDGPRVSPDLCCFLSIPELDHICRERINRRTPVRAHFSIDTSVGLHNQGLIVQWADPMRAVPFSPSFEAIDYPRKRQCVGVEIENVLLLYQLDSDERRWLKRRPVIRAKIGPREISQPAVYDHQIHALETILDVLEKHAGIPKTYPNYNGEYISAILEEDQIAEYHGCLAKFNYILMNNEPGAGLVPWFETVFGKLEKKSPEELDEAEAEAALPSSLVDLSQFESRKKELSDTPQPTTTFLPSYEDGPRFSLANAIAAAYASGKVARAGRIADRARKFDNT